MKVQFEQEVAVTKKNPLLHTDGDKAMAYLLENGGWLGGLGDRKQENHRKAACFVQLSLTRLSKNSVCSDEEAEAGAAKPVLFFFSP